jgi:hypothetical protein
VAVAVGAAEYSLGKQPVIGNGISWTQDELDSALNGAVATIVFDYAGKADVAALLSSLADTEFEKSQIARVLEDVHQPEDWRVGEAVAEIYITHHRACAFPWPDGRDERTAGSSLPGADLVGFHQQGKNNRFAFGEVKTSAEHKYPPQAMYGRTGLKQQLENLRDDVSIRDGLVKYLGYRAVNASWRDRYEESSKRYLADSTDVQLYGLLVRDVVPHEDDVKARVSKLHTGCPSNMTIEILGIYLPIGNVSSLSKMVMNSKKGGDA